MEAMNWGHRRDEEEEKPKSESYNDNTYYGSYNPHKNHKQWYKERLNNKKNLYELKLKEARNETRDERRIEYYLEALDYANEYFELSENQGITVEGMPERDSLFSNEDVGWISKKHYDEFYKIHILSIDQTENLEKLLKESGNGDVIKRNEDTRRENFKKSAIRQGIKHAKYLNEEYFRRIDKANDFALKNKPNHAVDEYQKAIRAYEDFFKSEYSQKAMVRKMPEKSLTPEAVDNILEIYVKTHPLLTSGNVPARINAKIVDMLNGEWDGQLKEADRNACEILEAKKLERQKRKEKLEDVAVDVIVGARIVGNSIVNRFKR